MSYLYINDNRIYEGKFKNSLVIELEELERYHEHIG